LSTAELDRLTTYEGPTWLDEVMVTKRRVDPQMPGFALELSQKLGARWKWLLERGFAERSSEGDISPKPDMMRRLRAEERHWITQNLSRELNLTHVPAEVGTTISGTYERMVVTPTAKLAVICREDTFTLGRWKPALEPMRGRAVVGIMRANHIAWSLDRGRELGRSR
jgi:hypothetical protein